MDNFELLKNYIEESNSSNSNTGKANVLKKYKNDEFLSKVLFYTYNNFYQYRISVKNLLKRSDLNTSDRNYSSVFDLLDDLRHNIVTGHAAISATNQFILQHKEYKELIYSIIDRNLKTRVTATTINKIIPNLIPEFNVALCEDYDKLKDKKKPNFSKERWYGSRKLDGVRTLTFINADGDSSFYSREGKQFKTFDKVAEELKHLGFKNIVLDGEMCLLKPNGDDDFQGIMKEYNKKDHTITNPRYRVFDCLTQHEFNSEKSNDTLSQRLERLSNLKDEDSEIVKKLNQVIITDQTMFDAFRTQAAEMNWEGIIIRKDTFYEGKRSKNMLKVKQFQDAEYVVKDVINGPMRVIVDELDGVENENDNYKKEETEIMLSAIVIEHKGCRVKVGSGFTIDERRILYKNPEKIIGKTLTVKYFEESKNQHGEYSLRFPVVKAIFEEKRDI